MNTATVALIGNPNCGKSTLFNALTGSRQHVGNYPGITVEKHEGLLHTHKHEITLVDLPGTYSLTAFSEDELVARNFLIESKPDAVITVLDATNLERSTYLVLQIQELGVPVIVVLNMMDEVRRKGIGIDLARLSALLKSPVVEIVARTGEGKERLLTEICKALDEKPQAPDILLSYGNDLDPVLVNMQERIQASTLPPLPPRWLAVKYLEEDAEILAQGKASDPKAHEDLLAMVREVAEHCQKTLDMEPASLIADYRYGYITSLLRGVVTRPTTTRFDLTDKLDKILTQRLLGPIFMLGVLYGLFTLTIEIGAAPQGWVEDFFAWLNGIVSTNLPEGFVRSLLTSGIIDGVGGVLSFAPLIMIMFFFLSFLEDSGYLARMAYMLDRVFRIFGLHGSSVVPFIISGGIPGGCAVPGVMAARTLRSPRERIATVLTAPFLSCGAKTPVFLLIAVAFFPDNANQALFLVTLGGWAAVLIASFCLRHTVIPGASTPFVMELPPYRLPTLQGMILHTWERLWQYVKKAGTVILAISILIWAGMTFPQLPAERLAAHEAQVEQLGQQAFKNDEAREAAHAELDNLQAQEALRYSIAGRIGQAMESVTSPAGFDWRTNIALLGGFAAKEVIVSSLGTAYSMGDVDPEESEGLSARLAKDSKWNKWSAISFMAFVLLYAPCFVTIAVIGREIGWRWAAFSIIFNTSLAYIISVLIYQVGTRL
ncbi:MAG: ferrous iron transport protein B [Desulfovibrionaceae bacterium]|nr:ferrous iron transport protein B [Desulfovibrionaceae bacterium]